MTPEELTNEGKPFPFPFSSRRFSPILVSEAFFGWPCKSASSFSVVTSSLGAGWEKIKPNVLKLLDRIRRTAAKRKDVETLQHRQKKLRPSYDKLKASLPKSAQPFMSLFTDFLLFESVKSLWANDKLELTDEAWHDSFDAILEEVEQYRVDLAHHARTAILAANGLEDEDGDDEPDFGAHFFHKPTSTLACALATCGKAHAPSSPPPFIPTNAVSPGSVTRTPWGLSSKSSITSTSFTTSTTSSRERRRSSRASRSFISTSRPRSLPPSPVS